RFSRDWSSDVCSSDLGQCLAIVDAITVLTYPGNNIVFRNFSPRLMVHFSALYRADKPTLGVMRDFVHYVKTSVTLAIAQNGRLRSEGRRVGREYRARR